MDYSPWSEGKFWLFWRQMKNEQNLRNWKGHTHQNWFACISHQPLLAWIFWADSIFWPPWTIVHGRKEKFGCFEGKRKMSNISETGEVTPTKIGLHAFHINLYLPEFFEPILFFDPMDYSPWSEGKFWLFWRQMKNEQNLRNRRGHTHQNRFACISHQPLLAWIFWANSIFWPPWTIVHDRKGNFGKWKMNKISETRRVTRTKIGLHAFHINPYLPEFFEPILFFDPHGL